MLGLKPAELAEMTGADFWAYAEARLLSIRERAEFDTLMRLKIAALQNAYNGMIDAEPEALYAAWTGRGFLTDEPLEEKELKRLFGPKGTTGDVIEQMMKAG